MEIKKVLIVVLVFIMTNTTVFADVPSFWAEAEINNGMQSGLLEPSINHSFQDNISRRDFAKLVVFMYLKAKGLSDVEQSVNAIVAKQDQTYKDKFKDLSYDSIDDKYVIVAAILGFVNGTSANTFSPNDSLTREQAAKILYTCYNKLGKDYNKLYVSYSQANTFNDHSKIADWAEDSVYSVKALNIMQGTGGNYFSPQRTFTREQAAITVLQLARKSNLAGDMISNSIYMGKRKAKFEEELQLKKAEQERRVQQAKVEQEKRVQQAKAEQEKRLKEVKKVKKSKKIIKAKPVKVNPNVKIKNEIISKEQVKEMKVTAKEATVYKAEVLRLINREREKYGLKPLLEGTEYASYADTRAKEIMEVFDHIRPDGSDYNSGMSGYSLAGENIAFGYHSPQSVVKAWMESEGHRANILNPDFEKVSIGFAYDNNNYNLNYWVQTFYTLP